MTRAAARASAAVQVTAVVAAPLLPGRTAVQHLDRALLSFVVAHRPARLRTPAVRLTKLAEPVVLVPAGGIAALVALVRGAPPGDVARRIGWVAIGIGARRLLAETVRRERPPESWWWHTPSGYSYPSRHVTWAVLGGGLVADLVGGLAVRRLATGLSGAVVATRIVLAVHWPSDVLAAVMFSLGWRRLSTPTPRGRSTVLS